MLQVQTGANQKFIASWIIKTNFWSQFQRASFKATNSFFTKYIKILLRWRGDPYKPANFQ